MKQAEDFREEARALAALLEPLPEQAFETPTLFKGWTSEDVVGHLHLFDVAALRTLESAAAFEAFFAPVAAQLKAGRSFVEAQRPWLDGLSGRALLTAWRETAEAVADAYAAADPKQRVRWAGPDMSALSAITARQMETWAHGQEVFDALGRARVETDRIRNICHLGAATCGWTFANRGMTPPDPAPCLRLTAPSGAIWTWNAAQTDSMIEGAAVEFARVVTQVRNIEDTALRVRGEAATLWMRHAQCFAGEPQDPPTPGSRHIAA